MIRLTRSHALAILDLIVDSGTDVKEGSFAEEAMLVMKEQIQRPAHADDLIDTVAKILASDKCRVVLAGSYLTAIQKAILSPTELARVHALSSTWQACQGCGRELINGEVVTLLNQKVVCPSCQRPVFVSCDNCHQPHELTGIGRIINKYTKECRRCAEAGSAGVAGAAIATAGATTEPEAERDAPATAIDPVWRTFVGGGGGITIPQAQQAAHTPPDFRRAAVYVAAPGTPTEVRTPIPTLRQAWETQAAPFDPPPHFFNTDNLPAARQEGDAAVVDEGLVRRILAEGIAEEARMIRPRPPRGPEDEP